MAKELAKVEREFWKIMAGTCWDGKILSEAGLKGEKGEWKEFLAACDRKFGASLSDPARRSADILVAFLESFTREEDIEFFSKMMRRHENFKAMEKMVRDLPGSESPQQRLVRLTVGHPKYIQNYSFPSHEEDWIVIPLRKVSKVAKVNAMISLDCEMVLCQDGTEAVVRVCVVDHNLGVKLDKIVNPNKPVADFRTGITGICSQDLEGVTCSLLDVQKALRKLLSHGTILVGHSLHNDLEALKIDHARVIDTSFIFQCLDIPEIKTPSLNSLCESVLGSPIRKEGDPHECRNDAEAAMKLVLAKIEHGFDDPIAIEAKKVCIRSESVHAVSSQNPINVAHQELSGLFPGHLHAEIQAELRVRGKMYSTFAVFRSREDADEAFQELKGQETKDCLGLPQKRVCLRLVSGETASLCVRKMAADGAAVSPKRPAEVDGGSRSGGGLGMKGG
ncbi:unnamed protein product [Spirodela intermedia]|uniref:Exonuclease domain-containing protein n=1 Tax=Spirodela intermedia TaxID=51605 RepID=A0A7I8JR12_SPIIN|nr:unnamed protein product [Spirodela intermedia]CAA6672586.1 unnamed protein product [Spirodela intermedia]